MWAPLPAAWGSAGVGRVCGRDAGAVASTPLIPAPCGGVFRHHDSASPCRQEKWGGFCCQAPPRAPPQLARAEDLGLENTSCITQRGAFPEQSCRWQLLQWASVGAQAGKVFAFTRPSILCRPQTVRATIPKDSSGGAAGHCPRVRSAYYARVYRHSLRLPEGVLDPIHIGWKPASANMDPMNAYQPERSPTSTPKRVSMSPPAARSRKIAPPRRNNQMIGYMMSLSR